MKKGRRNRSRMNRVKRNGETLGNGLAAKQAAHRKGRRKKHSKSGYTM